MQIAPETEGLGLPAGGFGRANAPIASTSRYVAVVGGLCYFAPVLFVG